MKISGEFSPPVTWANKLRPTMVPRRKKRRLRTVRSFNRTRRKSQAKEAPQAKTNRGAETSSGCRIKTPLTAKYPDRIIAASASPFTALRLETQFDGLGKAKTVYSLPCRLSKARIFFRCFLRLWVFIFWRWRFLPLGIQCPPLIKIGPRGHFVTSLTGFTFTAIALRS